MKNPLMAVLATVVTLTLTQPANAQSVGDGYLGGSIVQTTVDDYCDSGATVTVTNCSDDDTSVKLYGGYNLHKNFAVEGGYIDFGEVKGTGTLTSGFSSPVKSSAKSFFFAGIGKIHIHPKANLFGKFGLHRWDAEVETNLVDIDDDDVDLFYGIGGEVALFPNQNIKLRLEYEMFELENFISSGTDADLKSLSLGIIYTF